MEDEESRRVLSAYGMRLKVLKMKRVKVLRTQAKGIQVRLGEACLV